MGSPIDRDIGSFSAVDSFDGGVRILVKWKTLVLPFMFSAVVSTFPFMVAPTALRELHLLPVRFLLAAASWIIISWGVWQITTRAREEGILRETQAQSIDIEGFSRFCSSRNPLLPKLLMLSFFHAGLSIILSLLSNAHLGLPSDSSGQGAQFLILLVSSYLTPVAVALVNGLFVFTIYAILLNNSPVIEAIRLSPRIFVSNFFNSTALLLGLWVLSIVLTSLLNILFFYVLQPFTGVVISLGLASAIAGGILLAVKISSFWYAYTSQSHILREVRAAAMQGKIRVDCPRRPQIPPCDKCKQLQDFGDRYYCARYRKTLKKKQTSPSGNDCA